MDGIGLAWLFDYAFFLTAACYLNPWDAKTRLMSLWNAIAWSSGLAAVSLTVWVCLVLSIGTLAGANW